MRWESRFKVWVQSLYISSDNRSTGWIGWLWNTALYLAGGFLWGYFLNWGRGPFHFHDWSEITGPRLTFLKDAVTRGILPLHISNPRALNYVTDRFMSIPDVILSPQVLLLRFLEIGPFVLLNTLLLYSLGFLGLLWLQKKYSLSGMVLAIFFVFFNFNGHILAHNSVGHFTWGGYFLFPWLIAFFLQLLEGEHSWAWIGKTSLLLFLMFLQGSFHQYVWSLIFLALLAVFVPIHFWTLMKTGVFAILLSMVRILPPALLYGSFGKTSEFISGYPSIGFIWSSMVDFLHPGLHTDAAGTMNPTGEWEFSLFVGFTGTLFILYFGAVRWFRSGPQHDRAGLLLLPAMAISLLSLNHVFKYVHLLPIPLLAGERVASRMIVLPFMVLLTLAVMELQRWLDKSPHTRLVQVGIIFFLLAASHDLWQNFRLWMVLSASGGFDYLHFSGLGYSVVNRYDDRAYLLSLVVGLVISLLSLACLAVLTYRERRQKTLYSRSVPQSG